MSGQGRRRAGLPSPGKRTGGVVDTLGGICIFFGFIGAKIEFKACKGEITLKLAIWQ